MGRITGPIIRPVVLDNTVLTNFALVNKADLVLCVWPTAVCTTPFVLQEYRVGVDRGTVPANAWEELIVATLTEEETAKMSDFLPRLGRGERSCLAVAVCRQGLLATDDLDARREAGRHGVPVSGTIGILVLCVRRSFLSLKEANALLVEMMARGYRSPIDCLDQLIGDT